MTVLTAGINRVRDLTSDDIYQGGIGVSATAPAAADTGLFGGGTSVDACDATTGWSNAGDAGAETLNTTAGEFKEGTGCLNLPYTVSSGTGNWDKTIASTDMDADRLYVLFFVKDKTELTDDSATVRITIGTGGYTNINHYDFARSSLNNGWTWLECDIDNPTSTGGTGATETTIDRIRITVKADTTQSGNDMRMDYWHLLNAATQGVTATQLSITTTTSDKQIATAYLIPSTVGQGYTYREVGINVNSGTPTLLIRQTFADYEKKSNEQLNFSTGIFFEGSA